MPKIPATVWNALDNLIEENDLEYADNFRAYRVSDGFNKEKFERAESEGCCGFFDTTVIVNGEEWIVGCNYGH